MIYHPRTRSPDPDEPDLLPSGIRRRAGIKHGVIYDRKRNPQKIS